MTTAKTDPTADDKKRHYGWRPHELEVLFELAQLPELTPQALISRYHIHPQIKHERAPVSIARQLKADPSRDVHGYAAALQAHIARVEEDALFDDLERFLSNPSLRVGNVPAAILALAFGYQLSTVRAMAQAMGGDGDLRKGLGVSLRDFANVVGAQKNGGAAEMARKMIGAAQQKGVLSLPAPAEWRGDQNLLRKVSARLSDAAREKMIAIRTEGVRVAPVPPVATVPAAAGAPTPAGVAAPAREKDHTEDTGAASTQVLRDLQAMIGMMDRGLLDSAAVMGAMRKLATRAHNSPESDR